MSPYYYQVRKKKKGIQKGVLAILLIGCASVLLVSILIPSLTGELGKRLHSYFMRFAGLPSLLIPLYLGWLGVQQFVREKNAKSALNSLLFFAVFISLASFFSIFHTAQTKSTGGSGGWLGDYVSLLLIQQFGAPLTFIFSFLTCIVAGSFLIGISPISILIFLKQKIVQDISDWKVERKKIAERIALQKKLDPLPLFQGRTAPPATVRTSAPSTHLPEKILARSLEMPAQKPPSVIESMKKEGMVLPIKKANSPSRENQKSEELSLAHGPAQERYHGYLLPDPNLMTVSDRNFQAVSAVSKEELYASGTLLEQTLEQFHVKARVIDIHPGPVITRYDLSPAPGVRVQAIETLANDIALAMKAQSLRVLAPIPGKGAVGIEISNPHPAIVELKEIVLSSSFLKNDQALPLAIGKTTEGESFVTDLVAMPHLLIAGATGSGKSVCIHSLILSILFKFKPDEVKLLLIDPKRLELPLYDGIPHLYNPACVPEQVKVITEPKEIVQVLKKLIEVMEDRYKNFAKFSVRNIESYNEKLKDKELPPAPYIVVIIDELADLMIVVGREIEDSIQRLAQMARAVGIHLVLATQRPSVDVITGVIKANLPSRIAFQVLSKTDSRVILDAQGAEELLGRGDMLFLATGASKPVRLQGAYVSESDLGRVVQFIKEQNFKPHYESLHAASAEESVVDSEESQRLLVRAAKVVREHEKASGDLLRADKEIGSKYDLALTLLRKKGLIEKPKDTNRWKVHFDLLDEFLSGTEKE